MSIILPYKDLKNIKDAKFILPDGELLFDSGIHENCAKNYLFFGEGNRKLFMDGKSDDIFINLSHEQCEKLREYYKEHIKLGDFVYLFTDFMVKELKIDMIKPTQTDMYSNISNIKSGSPVIFKRFYNYYLMDELVDFIGFGPVDVENAKLFLEYGADMKFFSMRDVQENEKYLYEIKYVMEKEPNLENRKKYFK